MKHTFEGPATLQCLLGTERQSIVWLLVAGEESVCGVARSQPHSTLIQSGCAYPYPRMRSCRLWGILSLCNVLIHDDIAYRTKRLNVLK